METIMNNSVPDTSINCAYCGYNLKGNTSGRCPECGVLIGVVNSVTHGRRLIVKIIALIIFISSFIHVVAVLRGGYWPASIVNIHYRNINNYMSYSRMNLKSDELIQDSIRIITMAIICVTTIVAMVSYGQLKHRNGIVKEISLITSAIMLTSTIIEYHHVSNMYYRSIGYAYATSAPMQISIATYVIVVIIQCAWLLYWYIYAEMSNKMIKRIVDDIDRG